MTDTDRVIEALQTQAEPDGGWRTSDLRRECGLSAKAFAVAVQSLRYAGKMQWDRLALSASQMSQLSSGVATAATEGGGGREDSSAPPPTAGGIASDQATPEPERPLSGERGLSAGAGHVPGSRSTDGSGASRLAAEVAAEAAANVKRARGARMLGQGRFNPGIDLAEQRLSLGGQVQDIALRDDPVHAASLVRMRWNELWQGICASAVAAGERPMQAMLRLIESGLNATETIAEGGTP